MLEIPPGNLFRKIEASFQNSLFGSKPKKTFAVEGDGYCYFRCLSLLITGSANYNLNIRSQLCCFMRTSADVGSNVQLRHGGVSENLKPTKME